jgi:pimeloyl-ACP methyl ester carboxylesterase
MIASVGGIRLYYEWHGRAAGVPVVLVMGLGGDASAWGYQFAALAPTRRCLALDNRGVGRSDAPDQPYTVRAMARDLIGLLDALEVPRAHLLGVSLGGAIAQEAALLAPERVSSLQLHATWAGPDPYLAAALEQLRTLRRDLDREGFVRALLPLIFTPRCHAARPRFIERVVQAALAAPHPQPLHGYLRQAEASLGHDARDRLGAIRCPTLVTVGADDVLTPPRFARELATLVPQARLEVLPGGHGYFWEAPDAFNAACLGFLDAARDAPGPPDRGGPAPAMIDSAPPG